MVTALGLDCSHEYCSKGCLPRETILRIANFENCAGVQEVERETEETRRVDGRESEQMTGMS